MDKRRYLIWAGVVIILASVIGAFYFPSMTEASSIWGLDFGQNQPREKMRIQKTIVCNGTRYADGWRIAWREPLRCRNGQFQEIPMDRLKVALHNDAIPINDHSIRIETSKKSRQVHFLFLLDLTPFERPGRYEGSLILTPYQGKPNAEKWGEPMTLRVAVQVEPWLRMEVDATSIELDTIPRHDPTRLYGSEPIYVKVASNDRWNLLMKVVPINGVGQDLVLDVKVNGSEKFVSLVSPQVNAGEKWTPIISGQPTTGDGGLWTEFTVNLAIPDYRRYRAGSQRFHLNLQAKTQST